jgi:hypothetical protein
MSQYDWLWASGQQREDLRCGGERRHLLRPIAGRPMREVGIRWAVIVSHAMARAVAVARVRSVSRRVSGALRVSAWRLACARAQYVR